MLLLPDLPLVGDVLEWALDGIREHMHRQRTLTCEA